MPSSLSDLTTLITPRISVIIFAGYPERTFCCVYRYIARAGEREREREREKEREKERERKREREREERERRERDKREKEREREILCPYFVNETLGKNRKITVKLIETIKNAVFSYIGYYSSENSKHKHFSR
jgi:hypothetical protein